MDNLKQLLQSIKYLPGNNKTLNLGDNISSKDFIISDDNSISEVFNMIGNNGKSCFSKDVNTNNIHYIEKFPINNPSDDKITVSDNSTIISLVSNGEIKFDNDGNGSIEVTSAESPTSKTKFSSDNKLRFDDSTNQINIKLYDSFSALGDYSSDNIGQKNVISTSASLEDDSVNFITDSIIMKNYEIDNNNLILTSKETGTSTFDLGFVISDISIMDENGISLCYDKNGVGYFLNFPRFVIKEEGQENTIIETMKEGNLERTIMKFALQDNNSISKFKEESFVSFSIKENLDSNNNYSFNNSFDIICNNFYETTYEITKDNNTYTITDIHGSAPIITIPISIFITNSNDRSINTEKFDLQLGKNALTNLLYSQKVILSNYYIEKKIDGSNIKNIYLANDIRKLETDSFKKCDSLKTLVIPNSVKSISAGAISGCSSLQKITIPFVGGSIKAASETYQYPFGYIFGTLSYIGGTATVQYYYGSSTNSTTGTIYYIPSSLQYVTITGGNILRGAFQNCSNLININIPDRVTSIGDHAFYNCRSLTSIIIPSSIIEIESYAFAGCSNLSSILFERSTFFKVEFVAEKMFFSSLNTYSIITEGWSVNNYNIPTHSYSYSSINPFETFGEIYATEYGGITSFSDLKNTSRRACYNGIYWRTH